jgi:DNA polymerase-3 subunit gamma/tau
MIKKPLMLKYRPKNWAELVGQPAIVSILSRQVATKSWKNAYLFCGPAGCGKTTAARIFANEINNGEGSPIEIDAASNNGVDNIRALITDAQQSAIDCEYKIYIIDEVHMLTTAAWNAALKLIEEPPLNTVFIFCTTNPEKIPDTILSRVQRFDFLRVPQKVMADRLEYIMNEEEHKEYERVAIERISSMADGHLRDAIQLLEKCLDASDKLTLDVVETALGLVKIEMIISIVEGMIIGDMQKCLDTLDKLKINNSDMLRVFDSILSTAIDYAIYTKIENDSYVGIPKEYLIKIPKDAEKASLLVQRLMKFRPYASPNNAEVLLKTVIIEMCGGK